jgi:hypothetical protein
MAWSITVSSPRVADADLSTYRWYVNAVFSKETPVAAMNPVQDVLSIAADGSYAITASSKDASGNESAQSGALNLSLDHLAPTIPAAPSLVSVAWV